MEPELDLIVRRLGDVPEVKGDVRANERGPVDGPGMSRYQRRSARLLERDCSVEFTDSDDLDVALTGD